MAQNETFSAADTINQKATNYRWIICTLLFFATTINYVDRQVLSLLQPYLAEKFNWTYSDYANITSAFQLCYAVSLLFAGRFIDWLGTKKGYTWALILWSIGAIIHAFANHIGSALLPLFTALGFAMPVSVIGFIFARIVLGAGESGNFPSAIKTTAEWFPKKERSLSTGIFNSGANIGAVIAPLSVPLIAKYFGWEYAFIIVGLTGFLWLIFWKLYYDSPEKLLKKGKINKAEYNYIHSDAQEESVEKSNAKEEENDKNKVRWFRLLGYRQTWSFVAGKFLTDCVWWFFLFWLPVFLKSYYGMEGTQLMLPLAVLYTMTMVGSIGGGWLPTYFVNKGMNMYPARMSAMIVIALCPLVVLLAQPLSRISYWWPIALIGIGTSAHQAWSANIFTTVSDMFPKKVVASVIGIGSMAGSISGVIISKAGGWLFDHYKALGHIETGYTIMFAFCAIAYLIAWCVMKLLVPKFKPITDL
ncbi:MAG: MFS transporter [Endomicrobium sp.]|jgi:ACS family hexuronate transporter-like MFS transporter|nr:MFS transporter [Endomicrobium sp.]